MRRVRATPALLRSARALPRTVLVCAALLLLASCATNVEEDGHAPGAPAGVTAAAGSATSVHVMWDAVTANPGIDTYEIYRGTTKVKEVPGSEHMVDVTRLTPATMYAFTVRARDTDGRLGPRSREVRARTPVAVAADHSAPTRPNAPQGRVIGSRAVQLSWGGSTDDRGVVSYDIYQGGAKIHSVGGAQTATVVTGLRPSTRYSFTVRARDAADNLSPASTTVPLTTAPGSDDGEGTAPTEFRATTHRGDDGAYYIDLSWVPPRTDGVVTEYQIRLDGRSRPPRWSGAGPRRAITRSTASTRAGTPGSAIGCGSGRGCRTVRGEGSRRSGR